MAIQKNTDRIQTTHIGSLPRPHPLLDMMKAKLSGGRYDENAFAALLSKSVAESVRKQVDCGIDFVTDGEFSKPGFFTYIQERLDGFEVRPNQKLLLFQQEVARLSRVLCRVFQAGHDGRGDEIRRFTRLSDLILLVSHLGR